METLRHLQFLINPKPIADSFGIFLQELAGQSSVL